MPDAAIDVAYLRRATDATSFRRDVEMDSTITETERLIER
jgi:hypothetical protein